MTDAVRPLTFPVTLSAPELATLLLLVQAPRLVGAPEDLVPSEPEAREELLATGQAALAANGWLVQRPDGTADLNEELLLMVVKAAVAEVLVITRWEELAGSHYRVFHYDGGDVVVEMTTDGEVYTFTVLTGRPIMLERLANALEIGADALAADEPVVLSAEQATQLKDDPDPDWLRGLGVAEPLAETLAASIRRAKAFGTIEVVRTELATPISARLLGLVVSPASSWLADIATDGTIAYYCVDRDGWIAKIDATMSEVRMIGVPSVNAA